MALIYDAELSPTKIEVVRRCAQVQPWFTGPGEVSAVGAYRFDDPDGVAGVEIHLVRQGEQLLQVPLVYRPAPNPSAQAAPIAVMEHSVLGTRYVYPAAAEHLFWAQLVQAVVSGQGQVSQHDPEGNEIPPTMQVSVIAPSEEVGAEPAKLIGPTLRGSSAEVQVGQTRVQFAYRPTALTGRPDGALVGQAEGTEPLLLARVTKS